MPALNVVILAAGKGTRMESDLPKVLHQLGSPPRPMVSHVIEATRALKPQSIIVVTGHGADQVETDIGEHWPKLVASGQIQFVRQQRMLGTADAVWEVRRSWKQGDGPIKRNWLILNGDGPLIRAETLKRMVNSFENGDNRLQITTFVPAEPGSYGRIIRHPDNQTIAQIVEAADATPEQLTGKECNAGIYLSQGPLLFRLLDLVMGTDPSAKGEYYLTDIVHHAISTGEMVSGYKLTDPHECIGINTPAELSAADAILHMRSANT